jgi:anaerobic selenocysteine-containing dehydrogenase
MATQTTPSYCRACSGVCGVEVEVENGVIQHMKGAATNPKSAGYFCELGRISTGLPVHPGRILTPLRRVGDKLEPVSWEEAIEAIGSQIRALGKNHGQGSLALLAGGPLGHNTEGVIRTAAFAVGMGTPHLFSTLHLHGGPLLLAAEQMIGHPTPLQTDVGRAHVTLLLGAEQDQLGWGPMQSGTVHLQAMRHFQRTRKQAKCITVGSRQSELADSADQHVSIRPGTEVFFLLGMGHAILAGGWVDTQYLADHCEGLEQARAWLDPWTPTRCAEICGVAAEDISSVSLKFSRAAMATIVRSPALTGTRHATAAAWAWHLVHALTANLLRPGGAYETRGLVDLFPLLSSIPLDKAPRTRVGNHPALLMQVPATRLAEEISTGGNDGIRALICIDADPLTELPAPAQVQQALASLDLLVVIDTLHGPICEQADWVLPATSFWERGDVQIFDQPTLPYRTLQATHAVVPPTGEARPEADILADLFRASAPGLWGGGWGRHLALAGRWLATTNLSTQLGRLLSFSIDTSLETVHAEPQGLEDGEVDRSTWRVSRDSGRIDLAPPGLEECIRNLEAPRASEEHPLWLDTVSWTPDALPAWALSEPPRVHLHPDHGFADGIRVRVTTPHGWVERSVHCDATLRPDTVRTPRLGAGSLLGGPLDPLSATPDMTGVPCRVEAA